MTDVSDTTPKYTFQCYNCKKELPIADRDWGFTNVAPLRVCHRCSEMWGHEIYQHWRDHDINSVKG